MRSKFLSQILPFPHRLITNADAIQAIDDDEALLLQVRLHATHLIAAIQSGMPLDDDLTQLLKRHHQHLVDAGEPGLDLVFLNEL